MRAIVIKRYGGPEVLAIEERRVPKPMPGHVVIEVKAFGAQSCRDSTSAGGRGVTSPRSAASNASASSRRIPTAASLRDRR